MNTRNDTIPDSGMYVKKHVHSGEIYGGALTDILRSVASNPFSGIMKEAAKTTPKKALKTAATKTGDYAGKKAGDKRIQLLSKKNVMPRVTILPYQNEINERVNRIISRGFRTRNWLSHNFDCESEKRWLQICS